MKTTILERSEGRNMLGEVLEGLQSPQKTLPSKYFYDKKGSEIFEEICDLEEYYLTRTELQIMKQQMNEISSALGKGVQLIELGSGSSRKTRMLLKELHDLHSYVPVDISGEYLDEIAEDMDLEFPNLSITPVIADYTRPFQLPVSSDVVRTIVYFPGSTIGNFTRDKAEDFIGRIADLVGKDGGLLIGFDLLKDKEILEAAYNDSQGVTAAFNKNILARLNRELNADFNLNQFAHKAFFNKHKNRMEMHLLSLQKQYVNVDSIPVYFNKGETIHTENSHKYSLEAFRNMTKPYFGKVTTWMDAQELFAVQFLR